MKVVLILLLSFVATACSHGHKHGHKKHWKEHKQRMWKAMDANSDGKISKDEFTKAHAAKFEAMDANKDGFVTKEEKKAHMKMKMKHCKKCGDKKCDGKKMKKGCSKCGDKKSKKGECKECDQAKKESK